MCVDISVTVPCQFQANLTEYIILDLVRNRMFCNSRSRHYLFLWLTSYENAKRATLKNLSFYALRPYIPHKITLTNLRTFPCGMRISLAGNCLYFFNK